MNSALKATKLRFGKITDDCSDREWASQRLWAGHTPFYFLIQLRSWMRDDRDHDDQYFQCITAIVAPALLSRQARWEILYEIGYLTAQAPLSEADRCGEMIFEAFEAGRCHHIEEEQGENPVLLLYRARREAAEWLATEIFRDSLPLHISSSCGDLDEPEEPMLPEDIIDPNQLLLALAI